MGVKERIQQYLDYKGIKTARLERECSFSSGYWRKTKSISADACAIILGTYSDINPDWVFLGQGQMLRDNTQQVQPNSPESLWEYFISSVADCLERRKNQ